MSSPPILRLLACIALTLPLVGRPGAAGAADCHDYDPGFLPELGALPLASAGYLMAAGDGHAWVATSVGVVIVSLATPTTPTVTGTFPAAQPIRGLAVADGHAYVLDGARQLTALDLSGDGTPTVLGTLQLPADATGLAVAHNRALAVRPDFGLLLIDVAAPGAMAIASELTIPGASSLASVWLANDAAVVTGPPGPLYIVDLATGDAVSPNETALFAVAIGHGLVVCQDLLNRMHILDVSIPAAPVELGLTPAVGLALAAALSGDLLLLAVHASDDAAGGVRAFDLTDPAHPRDLGFAPAPATASQVAADDGRICALHGESFNLLGGGDPQSSPLLASLPLAAAMGDVAAGTGWLATSSTQDERGLFLFDARDPLAPVPQPVVWNIGPCAGMAAADSLLYVADAYTGVWRLDPTREPAFATASLCHTPGEPVDVAVAGSTVYVADGTAGLTVIDAANPLSLTLRSTSDTPGQACAVAVADGLVALADGSEGVRLYDPPQPFLAPRPRGVIATAGAAVDVAVGNGFAFVAEQDNGVGVYDVSNPDAPWRAGFLAVPTGARLALAGHVLYVSAGAAGTLVVDVTEPALPRRLGALRGPGLAVAATTAGDFLYALDTPSAAGDAGSTLLVALPQCGPIVPVCLSAFVAAASADGTVTVRWSLAEPGAAEFRLRAEGCGPPREIAFHATGPDAYAAIDAPPLPAGGGTVVYLLELRDSADEWIALARQAVDVPPRPATVSLLPAFPNPFNPLVTVPFVLGRAQPVRLTIHDVQGRLVATLVDGPRPAGRTAAVWDGTNRRGQPSPSGLYFARLRAEAGIATTGLVLAR